VCAVPSAVAWSRTAGISPEDSGRYKRFVTP